MSSPTTLRMPSLLLLLLLTRTSQLTTAAPNPFVTKAPIIHLASPTQLHAGLHEARQFDRCVADYCLAAYKQCVTTCQSLQNGDCFQVITSPNCEGCEVKLCGVGDGCEC